MLKRRHRRGAKVLAFLSAITGLLVFATSGISHAEVSPIVDYATYPPQLPVGCVDGENALINVSFSAGGATSASLQTLPLTPGQSFTMSWDGFAPGCEGVGVGLSSKIATVAVFDESTDYWLYDFAYCGPEAGATPCGPGVNELRLQVPPASDVPCYQLDAHLAPPLGQVGRSTAFYGYLNGVQSLLISAQNGGTGSCGPLPPCPTNPAIPAAGYLCAAAGTTTTVPTTTTPPPVSTSAPSGTACSSNPSLPANSPDCTPCSTNPAIPAGSAGCEPVGTSAPAGPAPVSSVTSPSCAAGQVRDATTGQCVAVLPASGAALPVTGRNSGSLASTGGLFLLSGLCLVYAYRRPMIGSATD